MIYEVSIVFNREAKWIFSGSKVIYPVLDFMGNSLFFKHGVDFLEFFEIFYHQRYSKVV